MPIEKWLYIDWQSIFIPSTSVAELFIRGLLVYLALFSVLRIFSNRQIGTLGIGDGAEGGRWGEIYSITNPQSPINYEKRC